MNEHEKPLIYLCSSVPGKSCFGRDFCGYLKKDLQGRERFVAIASYPDEYEENDSDLRYFMDIILSTVLEVENQENFWKSVDLIDTRTPTEVGFEKIKNADTIYLMPGDPFSLLEFIKFRKYEEALVKPNILIIGASAGSIVMAKDSYCSADEDFPETKFFEGLGLTDMTIDPHFYENNENQMKDAIEFSKIHPILGLPSTSAIRISPFGKVDVFGKCYRFINGELRNAT